jgi:uncharacterized protein (DUF58 family)
MGSTNAKAGPMRRLLRRLLFPPPPQGSWVWWLPPEGRCWLLAAILLLSVGLIKHINPVLLLSYLLLTIVVLNALAARRRLQWLRLRRSIEGPVFAGTAFPVTLELENSGRRAVSGVAVEDVGAEHELRWFLARIAGGSLRTNRLEAVLPRRGRYTWGEGAVVSGYPFGLVRRRLPLSPTTEVVVLPRLGWVHRGRLRRFLRSASPEGDAVRRRPQRHPSAQAEFHGLRAWRAGDSPRLIHWRTTARRGELMVREYEDVPSDNLVLVLDPTLPRGAGSEAAERFEAAVSLAATICWEWCRQTGERLIVAIADGGRDVLDGIAGPAHGHRTLERLALVEGRSSAALPAALANYADVSAAAVLIGAGPSGLAGLLARTLRRPVTSLDPTADEVREFYQPPGQVASSK